MPELSSLRTKLRCRNCDRKFDPPAGVIRFQWGEVPNRYRDGDAVKWMRLSSGEIAPPFHFIFENHRSTWNYGEPSYRDVLAFEMDPNEPLIECTRCGERYDAMAARVADGKFNSGVVFRSGEVIEQFGVGLDKFEVATLAPDGSWVARTDWNDPPLIPLEPPKP